MTTTTPMLRADLSATTVEDADGVLYYDVRDPKSGAVLRLFDFEWELAQRLDGKQPYEELIRFTQESFGFATTADDLAAYARKLQELGFIDAHARIEAPVVSAVPAPVAAVKSQPTPVVEPPASVTPPAPVAQVAPVTPPVSEPAPVVEARPPVRPLESPRAMRASSDDVMGRPVLPLPPPSAQRPTPAATKPAEPAATKPAEPVAKPAEPTPPPVAPIVQSPLREAISDLPEPKEPSSPVSVPTEPKVPAIAEVIAGAMVSAPNVAPVTPVTPVTTPAAPAPISGLKTVPIEQIEAPKPAEVKTEPSVKPPQAIAPTVKTPGIQTPERPTAETTPVAGERPGGAGKWIALVVIILIAVAAALYFTVLKAPAPVPATSVQTTIVKPEDVARTFPAPAQVKKTEPHVLKATYAGKVSQVVAEGAEVTEATALVSVEGQPKVQKELGNLKKALAGFQKKIDAAKAKGREDRDSQTKLEATKTRLGEVEKQIAQTQLHATGPAQVTKVFVKQGQALAVGADAVEIVEKSMVAELRIPALDAQGMKAGQEVSLVGASGPVAAKVAAVKVDGDTATVRFELAEAAAVKVGDELKLPKGTLTQAVRLPASVLVDGSKVFVVRDGRASVRAVTVAEHEGDKVLLQGLSNGDQVVTSRIAELREGVPVSPQPAAAP